MLVFLPAYEFVSQQNIMLQIEKLCCRNYKVVLLFATKLVDIARITTTDQLVSQQNDVTPRRDLTRLNFAARKNCLRVEKLAASLFNLFCSNVARPFGGFAARKVKTLAIVRIGGSVDAVRSGTDSRV